ncbi:MAG TPA: response regulator [Alphaproteobacteria bacterium]|jgi:DNA-binding response OmpR family regulator
MALRMLIIDDEPEIRDFLRGIAIDVGYDVVTASCAEDFKTAFAAAGADVILLDLTLPGTDGIELLKYMAEMGARARILIVSGFDEDIRRMAFTIGAARGLDMAGVLAKPLRVAELTSLLNQFLRDAGGPG